MTQERGRRRPPRDAGEGEEARGREARRSGRGESADAPPGDAPGSLGGLTELMRRVFAAGFSGFFLTEEALRKALGETLPKDWADFASEQSTRTRAEVIERLSYEVGRAVENVDWATVLSALLEGRTLEVRAEIRLGEKQSEGGQRLVVDLTRR